MVRSINKQIKYIKIHIGELTHVERVSVLQMIFDSSMDNKYIIEKPTGIQVSFDKIPEELIPNIYAYVKSKMVDDTTE